MKTEYLFIAACVIFGAGPSIYRLTMFALGKYHYEDNPHGLSDDELNS